MKYIIYTFYVKRNSHLDFKSEVVYKSTSLSLKLKLDDV